jgi:CheY-like chemotaxis protein
MVVIDDEVAIAADENKIQRILTNLALNARDAMKDGGRITLRLHAPAEEDGGPFARIEVTDTGAGMSEEVQARIFDPFFTTKAGSGTGLGLSSVKELVTANGGHVHVRSALQQGTTIAICWPSLTTWSSSVEDLPPTQPSATKLTVLFVDDDPIVRRALIRGLGNQPITLLEASNGTEAVEIARRYQDPIHVLCSDCVMPGLPIRQLIEEYRSLYPNGRVMVCSGYEPDDAGLAEGAVDDFFPKPFSASELAYRIRQLVTKPR